MESRVPPLLTILSQVSDPRHPKGLRHPLPAILALSCLATLCGCRSLQAMSEWGQNLDHEFLEMLGFGHPPPCANTLSDVLSRLDREELKGLLGYWAESILAALPPPEDEKEGVAIDGKTLRGSKKQGVPAAHLLSAVAHRLGLTLAQEAVDEKTNEIPVVQKLLRGLALEGRVFTVDALLTQREAAQTIAEGKGDYLMPVKGNQPQLLQDIQLLFEQLPVVLQQTMKRAETVELGHGRIEQRRLTASSALVGYLDWPEHQQVFQVERMTVFKKSGIQRKEIVYGITSLSPEEAGPERLLEYLRSHWHIENKVHWVRDVTFDEDRSQVRRGSLPQVLAAFRNTAIGFIRVVGETNIARACRRFAARPMEAWALISLPPKMLRTA